MKLSDTTAPPDLATALAQETERQRELAAYHEAGHAVARLWRGYPPSPLVEIADDGTGITHGTGQRYQRWDAYGVAVVTLAGYVAEWMCVGQRYTWDDEGITPEELIDLSDLLGEDFARGDRATTINLVHDHHVIPKHAVDEAESCLTIYWTVVEKIASTLITSGSVQGDLIVAWYGEHPGEPIDLPQAPA